MYTRTINPAFETIGKRRRLTGYLATLYDGETVVHCQEYSTNHDAEVALNALVYDLLSSDMVYSATDLDGGADDIDSPPIILIEAPTPEPPESLALPV